MRIAVVAVAAFALAGCALTPIPLTDADRAVESQADLATMFADQNPLTRPLTLEEAFSRALAYNLDHRVKLMEAAVARNDLDVSKYDLLPRVVANAGYTWRSNVEASSSTSIITGQQSLEPSTSTDRDRRLLDLTASWNILDFGVSYYTARQHADRTLIAEEQRRRVLQSLLHEVRRAFWRAASAQRLARQVAEAVRSAETALASSQKIESEGLRPPIDALRYQKAMLDLMRELQLIQRYLAGSKAELASLVNLPPGQNYTIAVPSEQTMRVERLRVPVRQMEEIALLRNPDLREASYQIRITSDESRKAILRLLPGINLNYGPQYDSNSFLVNSSWQAAAVRAAWNVMGLVSLPAQMQRGENAELLALRRRQALSIAVLAKVHISYQQYLAATQEYEWSARLASVDRRLFQQITNRVTEDAQGELERVTAQVSAATSDLRRYQSYAEAQAALGRLYATLGIDPSPDGLTVRYDLAGMIREMKRAAQDWQSGRTLAGQAASLPPAMQFAPASAPSQPESASAEASTSRADDRAEVWPAPVMQ